MWGILSVMVIIVKMDPATWDQVQDRAICISIHANALEKGMSLFVLPTAMSK